MNCLFWNVRGLNSKTKQLDLKDFLTSRRIPLISLVETKVEAGNAPSVHARICGDFHRIANYSHNTMGRIWIMWDPNLFLVDPQIYSDQLIHCCITMKHTGHQFYMTSIYALNDEGGRRFLWDDLKAIAQNLHDKPWLVGGDMNEDMKAMGHTLSWTNLQQERIASRLDRTLINSLWLNAYPESFTEYLAPGFSDHSALLVRLTPEVLSGHKPFKCFNMWFSHPTFTEVVENAWLTEVEGTPQYRLAKKLQLVNLALKKWNIEVFGDIHHKLKRDRDLLARIQNLLHNSPLDQTLILQEKEARMEYAKLVFDEESFIQQKSRQNNIQLGDCNSAFFYASVAARKAQNTLRKVKLPNGDLSDDPDIVKRETVHYFQALFNKESAIAIPPIPFRNTLSVEANGWAWDPVQTPRHSYTTWLALLDKLSTLQRLQKQGLLHSTQCPLCFRGSDEVHHLFFKCGYSSFIWLSLLSKLGLPHAICQTLPDWVECIKKLHLQLPLLKVVKVFFASSIGLIWRKRCSRIFHSQCKHKSMVLREIITTSRIRLSKYPLYVEPSPDIEKVAKNLGIPFHVKRYQDIFFTWHPPPAPWFKCNSDGSLSDDRAEFGAIIRDSQGHLIIGTMTRVSLASINHLELLGVKSDALMCAQLNLKKVMFETDSTTIVCWLQGRGAVPWTSRCDLIETMNVLSCFED
ncbi:hypothetical protein QJS10_CPB11g00610 [Acorus calamus]|uniref:Reverse transcriptase zinc-binding domain-containing protein n=1 Tax=Acorus calamus TaxID=4465 RepID=A0AAV9DR76_ACOCL|nr:hypothetical protein QJS10_CPB11g00610 [Acorus calamus]